MLLYLMKLDIALDYGILSTVLLRYQIVVLAMNFLINLLIQRLISTAIFVPILNLQRETMDVMTLPESIAKKQLGEQQIGIISWDIPDYQEADKTINAEQYFQHNKIKECIVISTMCCLDGKHKCYDHY